MANWNWLWGDLRELLRDLLLSSAATPIRLYIDALGEGGEDVVVQALDYFQALVVKAFHLGHK